MLQRRRQHTAAQARSPCVLPSGHEALPHLSRAERFVPSLRLKASNEQAFSFQQFPSAHSLGQQQGRGMTLNSGGSAFPFARRPVPCGVQCSPSSVSSAGGCGHWRRRRSSLSSLTSCRTVRVGAGLRPSRLLLTLVLPLRGTRGSRVSHLGIFLAQVKQRPKQTQ